MGKALSRSVKIGGVGGVAMIAAAQTRPEDAISNLAGWLKLFGVDHAPAFLNTLQADAWATALGILVALGSAIVWVWARQDRKLKHNSGVWLFGEGLDHMKVSREAPAPFEAKFFPLRQGYTDPQWSVQDELALEGRRREEQENGYDREAAWQFAADQARAIERDVSLSEALTYNVEGKWGCRYFDSVKAGRNPDAEPLTLAIQLAYDGKLTIWGKRSEAGVYEVIPKDFWASHHIDNFSLWREHAVTTAHPASVQGPRYFDLMVSRAQAEEVLRHVKP